jgi:hypothetical protein
MQASRLQYKIPPSGDFKRIGGRQADGSTLPSKKTFLGRNR